MKIQALVLNSCAAIGRPVWRRKHLKKLVLVGMVESSHFQNWARVIISEKLFDEIWVVPSDYPVNRLTFQSLGFNENMGCKLKVFSFPLGKRINNIIFRLLDIVLGRKWRSVILFRYLKRSKPNFLHFHELQHGAYLYNPIYEYFKNRSGFRVICSTWGSDLLFYGELDSHKNELEKVFSWTDTLTAERDDDFLICEKFDYKNKFEAPVYITVGLKAPIPNPEQLPSKRNKILIKGYQDSHGRSLNALAALELVDSDVSNIEIRIFSASESVKLQAEFLRCTRGWDIQVIGRTTNLEIKRHFSESRIYLGLAISDGLSTAMVEAMANGAFPIQSMNSAAGTFLHKGISGYVVNPWDLSEIAEAIDIALRDDNLVDKAMEINISTLEKIYNYEDGVSAIRNLYSN